jgi:hypothetical protein
VVMHVYYIRIFSLPATTNHSPSRLFEPRNQAKTNEQTLDTNPSFLMARGNCPLNKPPRTDQPSLEISTNAQAEAVPEDVLR